MGKGHSTLLWTCARTRTRPDARQCTTFLRPDSTVRVCKSAPSRAQITPSPRLPTFPPHTRRRALPTSPSPAPTRRIFVACDAQRYRRDRSNEMKQTPAMRGGRALTECLGEPADGLCNPGNRAGDAEPAWSHPIPPIPSPGVLEARRRASTEIMWARARKCWDGAQGRVHLLKLACPCDSAA